MGEPARTPQARAASAGGGPPRRPRRSKSLPKVVSREEMKAWIRAAYARSVRDGGLVTLAYFTAARRSELAGMKWEGWAEPRRTLRFWRPKNKDWHEVDLHPDAMEALVRLRLALRLTRIALTATGPIFRGQRGPLTVEGVRGIVGRSGRDAGIPADKARPHVLRHTRAYLLLEDGYGVDVVQQVLGHADVSTTSLYLHVSRGRVAEAMNGSGL